MRALVLSILALAACDRVFGLERTPDAPPPPSRWASVAGGELHTCGIRLDHTLWCWGRNDHGELGARDNGSDWEVDEPRQVGTEKRWTQVAAGLGTTCAIEDDHTLWCFGDNARGEVGIGAAAGHDDVVEPAQVAGEWRSVAVADTHTCAIRTDGSLACWGSNTYGELGDGSTMDEPAPVEILAGSSWEAIAAGGSTTCGLQADHTAWCWGMNAHAQVGVPGADGYVVPQSLGATAWQTITVGAEFACALRTDGKLRCWGRNNVGQVGDGFGIQQPTPAPVGQDDIADWSDVRAGATHACGLHGDGELACWGSNEHGELVADPSHPFRTEPLAVDGTWASVATALYSTCVIDRDGRLSCAGYGPAGGLGAGVGSRLTPALLEGSWNKIGAGASTTCALRFSTMSCWGENSHGAVGDGTRLDRQAPIAIAGAYTALSVFEHVCAVATDGSLACWGANGKGQLGSGAVDDLLSPATVNGGPWSATASSYHTCAVTQASQQLYCWGDNVFGQLATSPDDPPMATTPLVVGGNYTSAATGGYHTCGLDLAGGVNCWGYGADGALGVGFLGPTGVAMQVLVPGKPKFDAITAGERFTCAHTIENQVWCWGSNSSGQLGDLTTLARPLPIQLAGDWIAIAAGKAHMCGVHPDHSLWCWGSNKFGQLGDGSLRDSHEPVQIGSDTDWTEVSAGDQHTCARKAGDAVWCWGGNLSGALGDGAAWRATLVEITR